MAQKKNQHLRTALISLSSGAVGAGAMWLLLKGSLSLKPANMSFADLAAVMLGAVAVLLTILAVFLAVFAIWGYSQFRSIVEGAATRHASLSIREGELKDLIEERALDFMRSGFETGRLRKLLEERVDQIILRGPEQRSREETRDEQAGDI